MQVSQNVPTVNATPADSASSIDFHLSESFQNQMSLGTAENSCASKGAVLLSSTKKASKAGKKENATKKHLSLASAAGSSLGSSLIKPVPIQSSLAQNVDNKSKHAAAQSREFGRELTNAAGHKASSILVTAPSSASGKAKTNQAPEPKAQKVSFSLYFERRRFSAFS